MTQPIAKFRDGRLTATIWKNERVTESGEVTEFYNVDLKRSYKDEADTWQESSSFTGAELLRVANLATQAYQHILTLRHEQGGQT